jgi:hypothetical protein
MIILKVFEWLTNIVKFFPSLDDVFNLQFSDINQFLSNYEIGTF